MCVDACVLNMGQWGIRSEVHIKTCACCQTCGLESHTMANMIAGPWNSHVIISGHWKCALVISMFAPSIPYAVPLIYPGEFQAPWVHVWQFLGTKNSPQWISGPHKFICDHAWAPSIYHGEFVALGVHAYPFPATIIYPIKILAPINACTTAPGKHNCALVNFWGAELHQVTLQVPINGHIRISGACEFTGTHAQWPESVTFWNPLCLSTMSEQWYPYLCPLCADTVPRTPLDPRHHASKCHTYPPSCCMRIGPRWEEHMNSLKLDVAIHDPLYFCSNNVSRVGYICLHVNTCIHADIKHMYRIMCINGGGSPHRNLILDPCAHWPGDEGASVETCWWWTCEANTDWCQMYSWGCMLLYI